MRKKKLNLKKLINDILPTTYYLFLMTNQTIPNYVKIVEMQIH
jgi:hypothetical protein